MFNIFGCNLLVVCFAWCCLQFIEFINKMFFLLYEVTRYIIEKCSFFLNGKTRTAFQIRTKLSTTLPDHDWKFCHP